MRTTIAIQDDLLEKAKRRAIESRTTLGEFIEDVLRVVLSSPKSSRSPAAAVRLLTFRGRGLQPGVDLDHTAALLDAMEDRRSSSMSTC